MKSHGNCIEWHKYKQPDGYGRTWDKKQKKNVLVHRQVWERSHGEIPDGFHVAHLCHNPSCYNIEHLYLATPKQNERDKISVGRHYEQKKTHCPRGHAYEGDNLIVYPSHFKTKRICRECRNWHNKRRSLRS